MKLTYLFPHRVKKLSGFIFILCFGTLIVTTLMDWAPSMFETSMFAMVSTEFLKDTVYFSWIETNMWYDLLTIIVIISGILFAFSKERIEDEYISNLRLSALVKAVYCNYAILILAIFFIYNLAFFSVLILNMLSTLILFILFFQKELISVKRNNS
ncbi:hypothetical protein ACFQ3R_02955 [Mesonia ostreae]|uniref:Uncharacterized protein n=1 Tax=Mesonia ostreae TaxID=861110 RepID=A0ABU2KL37_9FLAO|nr:hypothetical protein [Mesonia ostreae]MDT0295440.1 hypothetical protein [Mesonia ostreae]